MRTPDTQQETVVDGLAAIDRAGDVRAEDRRRFARRREDDAAPALHELEAAVSDLRQRVDSAQEIRQELIGARDVVAALREELQTMQAELAAERVASRRARMQASWLEGELRRRQETEQHLRAALASLTEAIVDPDEKGGGAAVARATEGALASERAARERAERDLLAAREELAALREPARPSTLPAGAVAELRDALAELSGQRHLNDAWGAVRPVRDLDFDAAAERLRNRTEAGRTGQIRLAPRGISGSSGPWLRDGLLALAADEPARAERLMIALIAAQAGCAPRPISYGLVVRDGGSYRVSVMQQGAAVGALGDLALDGRVTGPLPALIPLAAGGGSARLSGARVRGRGALRPLLATRRRPVQLSELALLLHPLDPATLLELSVLAVDPDSVTDEYSIDFVVEGIAVRVVCPRGLRPRVVAADATAADATVHASRQRLAAVLAGQDEVAVDGDASKAAAFLALLAEAA
jgi:hypothetical protein